MKTSARIVNIAVLSAIVALVAVPAIVSAQVASLVTCENPYASLSVVTDPTFCTTHGEYEGSYAVVSANITGSLRNTLGMITRASANYLDDGDVAIATYSETIKRATTFDLTLDAVGVPAYGDAYATVQVGDQSYSVAIGYHPNPLFATVVAPAGSLVSINVNSSGTGQATVIISEVPPTE